MWRTISGECQLARCYRLRRVPLVLVSQNPFGNNSRGKSMIDPDPEKDRNSLKTSGNPSAFGDPGEPWKGEKPFVNPNEIPSSEKTQSMTLASLVENIFPPDLITQFLAIVNSPV